jgi:hypothetical protein
MRHSSQALAELLRYQPGKRRNGTAVRAAYLRWRSEQSPALPERCDSPVCKYYSEPFLWNGKPLKLILDHENGVNTDNAPKNLRLLCPNCDSQNSETRGGANKGRVIKSSGGFSVARTGSKLRDYTLRAETGTYELGGSTVNLVASNGKPARKGAK